MDYKSAIREMFFNGKGGIESVKTNSEYAKKLSDLEKSEENLLNGIKNNKAVIKLFKDYSKDIDELNCIESYLFYESGFRFGVLLGLDVVEFLKEK